MQIVGISEVGGNRLVGLVPNLCFVLNNITEEQHLLVNRLVTTGIGELMRNSVQRTSAAVVERLCLA
jgi:hypothetical protein